MIITKSIPTHTNCHWCDKPGFKFNWYVDDDRRKKPVASVVACSEVHARKYFEKFKSIILNGEK